MDAADLDRRARTLSGCIPPHMVSRLLDLGHGAEVEFQAGRGEWFCAREWARLLGEQGRRTEASEVLAPYVATGWWPAARAQAELLESWGRTEEAIALAQPYGEAGGSPLEFYGRLLARHGREDEAIRVLSAGIEDPSLARVLVDIAEDTGRDEEIAALLAARIPARHRCDAPWCCRGLDPDTAIGLLAEIRERQGRVDEAIALLHTRHITSVNNHDQLADLLARRDRIDELRVYAASEYLGHAARRLAEVLEERGDVEGAIAVYRQPGDSPVRQSHGAVELARLLARHDRGDEAIAVMRTLVDPPGGADDWLVDTLCTLYADHGRSRDGLAYLDVLKARRGGEEEWDFFRMRLRLMADCGLLDEAIEQARAHPEGDTWYAAWTLSDLLTETGRTEEAVAVLEPHASTHRDLLAGHLIDLGRVEDAVALLQQRTPEPVTPVWTGTFSTEPPF
ncbi:tetratricopeptide repeat protein [Streptomyces sp. NPDC017966]|uniref:tetratricopeptide repeat protein n=1 Tax=Streptomyces sp. NPDC017966 TaxID=3365023 RepID=UPI00378D6C92